MVAYVSGVLGHTVVLEELLQLTDEELTRVEQALTGGGVEPALT